MGHLFHSKKEEPKHTFLMTEEKFELDEKRLYAIYEKGYCMNVVR